MQTLGWREAGGRERREGGRGERASGQAVRLQGGRGRKRASERASELAYVLKYFPIFSFCVFFVFCFLNFLFLEQGVIFLFFCPTAALQDRPSARPIRQTPLRRTSKISLLFFLSRLFFQFRSSPNLCVVKTFSNRNSTNDLENGKKQNQNEGRERKKKKREILVPAQTVPHPL